MTNTDDVATRFARETAEHEMTIMLDTSTAHGLYRHLRFANPDSFEYWWELVTWPGSLAVRGDMGGDWIFTRTPDMFRFFRSSGDRINPSYWANKTERGRHSCEVYREDLLRKAVTEAVEDAVREGTAPEGLERAVTANILEQDLSNEHEALELVSDFEHGLMFEASCLCGDSFTDFDAFAAHRWRYRHIDDGNAHLPHTSSVRRTGGFNFENDLGSAAYDFDESFLWACHAIVRGIHMYDLHHAIPEPVGPDGEGSA